MDDAGKFGVDTNTAVEHAISADKYLARGLSRVSEAFRTGRTALTSFLNGLVMISLAARIGAQDTSAFASSIAIDHRRVPSRPEAFPWMVSEKVVTKYVPILFHEYDYALVAKIRSMVEEPAGNSRFLGFWMELGRVVGSVRVCSREVILDVTGSVDTAAWGFLAVTR